MFMGAVQKLKQAAKKLKTQTLTLCFACKHPDTPWYAKAFAGLIVAYALSPIDLIPDFIPILGYLDDLILIPAGLWLALKMIPKHVMEESALQAQACDTKPVNRWFAAVIICIWVFCLFLILKAVIPLIFK